MGRCVTRQSLKHHADIYHLMDMIVALIYLFQFRIFLHRIFNCDMELLRDHLGDTVDLVKGDIHNPAYILDDGSRLE